MRAWRTIQTGLVAAALGAGSLGFDSNAAVLPSPPSANASLPSVNGSFVEAAQIVFATSEGCDDIDLPDASAHAFRDYQGTVHLFATHFVARAMTGKDLKDIKHQCKIVYQAPHDPNPAHFQYDNWLYSFYTIDGRHIAALVHSEYHGWEIPAMCTTPAVSANCWWNTITFAQSDDGGESFIEPQSPKNLVASLPYPYVVGNRASAYGYFQPTNILKKGQYYYALINDWPYKAQRYGACLMRTTNVFDPGSWRAWDGQQFAVQFVDPYLQENTTPEKHVCAPVMSGVAESLVVESDSKVFIVSVITPDARFGPPGLYLTASTDLINWTQPSLVEPIRALLEEDGPGKWTYGYSSLLDPTSQDRNFTNVSTAPFIFYVRMDEAHHSRALLKRKLSLRITR